MALLPVSSGSRNTMSVVGGRTIEGELASANPTTRAQDAGLQEPRISPTIPLNPCSHLQYLQRPTSPDFSVDAPRLPRRGDGHLACGGRLRTYDTQPLRHAAFSRSSFSNVTRPLSELVPHAKGI